VARREVYPVAVVCGLMAGLRMREAARLLMRDGAAGFEMSPDGEVRWKERRSTKTNLRGGRWLADRTMVVTPAVMAGLRQMKLPWKATEQEATRVVRETAATLTEIGVPRDVRVFRRSLARDIREGFVSGGASEEEALFWVRKILGHRPGSETTFRYLGSALSDQGARRLGQAWKEIKSKVV